MSAMGLPAQKRRLYSIAEYLAMEERAEFKSEFHDGEILAMAGGTIRASQIMVNLYRSIGNRLLGGPCTILESNARIRIGRRLNYVYPDATIVCGQMQYDPDDPKQTTITNPRVVIEVLSESTAEYDRGEKFRLYRQLESLEEYVLVEQNKPLIETFRRHDDGRWQISAYHGVDVVAKLASVPIEFPLSEVYLGLDFPDVPVGPPPEKA